MEEALRAAAAIGDDRLQKMVSGRVMPDRFTHGSSAQRVECVQTRHGIRRSARVRRARRRRRASEKRCRVGRRRADPRSPWSQWSPDGSESILAMSADRCRPSSAATARRKRRREHARRRLSLAQDVLIGSFAGVLHLPLHAVHLFRRWISAERPAGQETSGRGRRGAASSPSASVYQRSPESGPGPPCRWLLRVELQVVGLQAHLVR